MMFVFLGNGYTVSRGKENCQKEEEAFASQKISSELRSSA